MNLSKSARAAAVAAALTAGVTAAVGPGFAVAAVDKVQDVFITNDAARPVPTKAIGTTKVDATGQTLTIQGEAGRALPVEVTNAPAADASTILQQRVVTLVEPGERLALGRVNVPEDERWTIERVSYANDIRPAQRMAVRDFSSGTMAHVPVTPGKSVDHLTKLHVTTQAQFSFELVDVNDGPHPRELVVHITGTRRPL